MTLVFQYFTMQVAPTDQIWTNDMTLGYARWYAQTPIYDWNMCVEVYGCMPIYTSCMNTYLENI